MSSVAIPGAFITLRALVRIAVVGLHETIGKSTGDRRHALRLCAHRVGAVLLAPTTIFAALAPETEPASAWGEAHVGVALLLLCFISGMGTLISSILSVGVLQEPGCLLATITFRRTM
jgi:phage tail tape-measure protein